MLPNAGKYGKIYLHNIFHRNKQSEGALGEACNMAPWQPIVQHKPHSINGPSMILEGKVEISSCLPGNMFGTLRPYRNIMFKFNSSGICLNVRRIMLFSFHLR